MIRKSTFAIVMAVALLIFVMGVHGLISTPRPRLTLELFKITADSVFVKATFDSRDARGNPVHHYDAALTRAVIGDTSVFWQAQVLANVTGLGTATIGLTRPLAGDTMRLWLDASATDSKGSISGFARSTTLVIGTPWSPPTPPTITIDTIAYEPGHPDGLMMYVAPPTWGGRAEISTRGVSAAPGDTFTVFVFAWDNGYMRTPLDSAKWWIPDSDSVTIRSTGWNRALVTVLFKMALQLPPPLPTGIPITALGRP